MTSLMPEPRRQESSVHPDQPKAGQIDPILLDEGSSIFREFFIIRQVPHGLAIPEADPAG